MADAMKERIISADSHASIPHAKVLEYLPEAAHEPLREAQMAFYQAKMAMRPQKAKAATAPMPNMGAGAPWEAAGREGEHDPIERLKDMDTDGVDAEVLYMGSGGEAFYGVPREYLVDVFRGTTPPRSSSRRSIPSG